MVYYQHFCCCMSTKTGVKIVSIMVLILFMVYLISLGMFWTCRPLKNHEATNLSVAVKIPVDDSVTDTKGIDDKDLQEITREAMVYLIRAMGTSYIGQMAISDDDLIPASIFSCIVCVIAIIFWAMLLIGVFKNNKCLILTWMVMTMLHLLLDLFTRTYMFIIAILYADPDLFAKLVPHLIVPGVFILIFGFYFWDVVFSVYRDLKNRTED